MRIPNTLTNCLFMVSLSEQASIGRLRARISGGLTTKSPNTKPKTTISTWHFPSNDPKEFFRVKDANAGDSSQLDLAERH